MIVIIDTSTMEEKQGPGNHLSVVTSHSLYQTVSTNHLELLLSQDLNKICEILFRINGAENPAPLYK